MTWPVAGSTRYEEATVSKPDITEAVLDQWQQSAEADLATDRPWSCHPAAILEVVAELRRHRRANLVQAVLANADQNIIREWVTEAINVESFDRVPWLVAQKSYRPGQGSRGARRL